MKATTRGDAFLIFVLPSLDVEPRPCEIISKYQEFKDVFEKKNANTLLKHRPYNYIIDLVEEEQPPFKPIYNLLQGELAMLHEYLDENLEKGFI
jgi:hypothetical protein